YYGPRDVAGLERFIREKIPHYALTDPCAEKWAYSNPGINIVGYILELVTGKPYAEAMRSLVFEPLAMERTTFDPTIAITYPVAQAHEQVNDETLRVIHRFADNVAYYPSGLAMSTALDLANFALMHLNEGRFHLQAFLRPDTLKEMHRKHVNLTTISDDGYGLTFFVDNYKGLQRISHYGAIGTFSCQFMVIPQKLAVVMVNNRLDNFKDVLLVNFIIDRLLELPDKKGITRK
ncbi:MAG TPA: serine hydrolase domain-containing protein, partial [Ktedonobacteraceae bacterium]|nr:serine hydrolase domain-containing protein [Ktedonobacteraceae bacterium]